MAELVNRAVVHIDVADFAIAVERVLEPRLRQRPVAIAVQNVSRSLVCTASFEARQQGVRAGLPLQQALKNCSDLCVLPPNHALYRRVTLAMGTVLSRFSPVIEPLRFGHAYVDMTGSGRLFGGIKDAAAKAQRDILQELQLPANVGVAGNKLVSKVASDIAAFEGELQSLIDVRPGDESGFLAPLNIGFLPGVKSPVRNTLVDLNVRIIRELCLISVEHLQMVFGRFGRLLYQRAHGIDNRPVQPSKRSPQIVEVVKLHQDSNDYDLLCRNLYRLLYAATRRLRQTHLSTRRLSIDVHYSNHKIHTLQRCFGATANEQELLSLAQRIFERQLLRVRVRKLVLRLQRLCPAPRQLSLFAPPVDHKLAALRAAMDEIRNRYGEDAIQFGRAA
ncbi:hypothetical protein GF407_09095 [candidate division KSB1 bacterium]|nr:hypothetical protein [candidate division KSB1 bacterium]